MTLTLKLESETCPVEDSLIVAHRLAHHGSNRGRKTGVHNVTTKYISMWTYIMYPQYKAILICIDIKYVFCVYTAFVSVRLHYAAVA